MVYIFRVILTLTAKVQKALSAGSAFSSILELL